MVVYGGVFINGVFKNCWFIVYSGKSLEKMDDLGVASFQETTI